MRIFYLFVAVFVSCFARENPFVPSGDINGEIITTNIKEEYEVFNKQSIKFPSDASLLLNIKIKYRANDGTIKEKSIDINKTINHNDEYALLKLNEPKPVVSKKLDVSVTMPDVSVVKVVKKSDENATLPKPSDAPILTQKSEQNNTEVVVKHVKTPINEQVKTAKKGDLNIKLPLKSVKFMDFIRFDADKNRLNIITKDKIIRHFKHEKDKIVVDFKGKPMFKTKDIELNTGEFSKVTLGWHKSFYRVVIKLKKPQKYELNALKDESGYEINLK
ncbi:AMIN domain-containing protein [Campylobacter gastrosuis]|uniref:AMIN domain-containing protein n=1 Tax=Campylobacter gastrosuis TaxID=2974576 RepID=A0ABT7HQT9_9BACT|nr:AMIN domain-containing protein [Campylobacter gastrosuis]MDL0088793.1 AMIN domain-containing protein [Campylobacter gastrosuis]